MPSTNNIITEFFCVKFGFREFCRQQDANDLDECYRQLDESLVVSCVQNTVRYESGVVFPADEA